MSIPKNIFSEDDGSLSGDFWRFVLGLAERAVEALEAIAEGQTEP